MPPDEDPGTTPTGPSAPGGVTPGASARVATLDSIRFPTLPAGAGLNILEQWETNAGLYFLVADPATVIGGVPTTVFRYNPGASGAFQTTTIPGFVSSIRPSNQYTEGTDVIALLYAGLDAFGQKNVNNGIPDSRTVQRPDQDIQILIPDRSSTARNWAIADINDVMAIARQSAVISQGFSSPSTPRRHPPHRVPSQQSEASQGPARSSATSAIRRDMCTPATACARRSRAARARSYRAVAPYRAPTRRASAVSRAFL